MKAILEFNLPEEDSEFQDAINGNKWSMSMWELDQHLRSLTKYPSEPINETLIDAYEEIRTKLYEILNENNLKF